MPRNDTELFRAAKTGRYGECRRLIKAGADPRPPNSYTPLMAAVENGKLRCVRVLAPLSDVLAVDECKMNAAMLALACGLKSKTACHEILQLLFAGLNQEQRELCCSQRSLSNENLLYLAINRICVACANIIAPYSDVLGKSCEGDMTLVEAAAFYNCEIHQILKSHEGRCRAAKEKARLDGAVPCPQSIAGASEPKRL